MMIFLLIWNEMLTISVCILGIIFIVSKSSKSYLSCVAFWIPFFFYQRFWENNEETSSFIREEDFCSWGIKLNRWNLFKLHLVFYLHRILKKKKRWGIQKGNSYCKSYLSLPFRSKASKLKCVAMLSSHCLLSFFIKRQCTSYQNNWNQ